MKEQFIQKRFHTHSMQLIEKANEIISDYRINHNMNLTLRQLYYQFVQLGLIPNTQKQYKVLGSVINDARLAGLVDWNAIEDRTRNLAGVNHQHSPEGAVKATIARYELDKWSDQDYRVEVWIEKDALLGVIENVCVELDVDYFSCRGYTSQSEMWRAGHRLKDYLKAGQKPIIIHLGDHDPSGKDMTRDILDRMKMFCGEEIEVDRIALNMTQVRKYNPPPNPAKLTDSRCEGYIKKFGNKSWELDALNPTILETLIRKTVLQYRNTKRFKKILKTQEKHVELLTAASEWMEKQ